MKGGGAPSKERLPAMHDFMMEEEAIVFLD
jgi:hypothetical protein